MFTQTCIQQLRKLQRLKLLRTVSFDLNCISTFFKIEFSLNIEVTYCAIACEADWVPDYENCRCICKSFSFTFVAQVFGNWLTSKFKINLRQQAQRCVSESRLTNTGDYDTFFLSWNIRMHRYYRRLRISLTTFSGSENKFRE